MKGKQVEKMCNGQFVVLFFCLFYCREKNTVVSVMLWYRDKVWEVMQGCKQLCQATSGAIDLVAIKASSCFLRWTEGLSFIRE